MKTTEYGSGYVHINEVAHLFEIGEILTCVGQVIKKNHINNKETNRLILKSDKIKVNFILELDRLLKDQYGVINPYLKTPFEQWIIEEDINDLNGIKLEIAALEEKFFIIHTYENNMELTRKVNMKPFSCYKGYENYKLEDSSSKPRPFRVRVTELYNSGVQEDKKDTPNMKHPKYKVIY